MPYPIEDRPHWIDIMLSECVPAGRLCDPVTVSTALKHWLHKYLVVSESGDATTPAHQRWSQLETLVHTGTVVRIHPTPTASFTIRDPEHLRCWIDGTRATVPGEPCEYSATTP